MLQRLLCLVLAVFGVTQAFLDGAWDHDVYSGRHWNDLVTESTSTSSTIKGPSFLVLYKPSCERQMFDTENLFEKDLPPQQYITFGKFDTKTTAKHVWYPFDSTDNLTDRYQPRECPEYLFFPDNGNLYSPERYSHNSGVKVMDWIWSKVAQRFTIRNERSTSVTVDIRGHKPAGFTVEPGQEIGFNSYISFVLFVNDQSSGEFVHGLILDKTVTTIIVRDKMRMSAERERWYKDITNHIKDNNKRARDWRWGLAQIYLTTFKQPVLLPTLTNVGYRVRQIPKMLFEEIQGFYRSHKHLRERETMKLEPAVNQDTVATSMVHLDAPMSERIAEVIKPMVQDWLDRTVELTRMYGIREFHKGNILRPHVARVGTQVASAVLVVHKDLDGEPDWDFQVTLYDGQRKSLNLNPGQMIFFESATLIHGFPFPFKGKDMGLIFIHFRPFEGWTWDLHPNGHWIMHDGEPQEYIDQLITPKTYMKATKGRVRDEL